MLRTPHVSRVVLVAGLSVAGCASILGLPDYGPGAGGAGGNGTAGSGGASASSGKASSTGSTASSGGVGTGGGAPACEEGAPCYFGLDGTEGVPPCKGGTMSCEGGVPSCNDVRPAVQVCTGAQSDANCDGVSHCTGDFRWDVTGYTAVTRSLAAGADGSVAVVGSVSPAAAAGNLFAVAFDARGRRCWGASASYFGGAGVLSPLGVALEGNRVTPDGRQAQVICGSGGAGMAASTVVVGAAAGPVDFGMGAQPNAGGNDGFVALLDPAGKVSWGVLFGSAADDQVAAVTTDASGAIYVTGYVEGPATLPGCAPIAAPPPSTPNSFVAKLAPDGMCGWIDVFTGNVAASSIALGKNGSSVVVVGRYYGTVNFNSVVSLPSGGTNMNNTFVARVATADGTIMGTPANLDLANANATDPVVAVGPDDAVFVGGTFTGGYGACSSTDEAGYLAPLDATTLAPTSGPFCYAATGTNVGVYGLAVDAASNVVLGLAGNGAAIQSSGAGFSKALPTGDFIVVKLGSPLTDVVWSFAAVPTGVGYAGGIGVDGMGDVTLTANTNMAFNLGPATVGGQNVSFVLGLAP